MKPFIHTIKYILPKIQPVVTVWTSQERKKEVTSGLENLSSNETKVTFTPNNDNNMEAESDGTSKVKKQDNKDSKEEAHSDRLMEDIQKEDTDKEIKEEDNI